MTSKEALRWWANPAESPEMPWHFLFWKPARLWMPSSQKPHKTSSGLLRRLYEYAQMSFFLANRKFSPSPAPIRYPVRIYETVNRWPTTLLPPLFMVYCEFRLVSDRRKKTRSILQIQYFSILWRLLFSVSFICSYSHIGTHKCQGGKSTFA